MRAGAMALSVRLAYAMQCAACVILTPVDDIRETKTDDASTCRAGNCMDAGAGGRAGAAGRDSSGVPDASSPSERNDAATMGDTEPACMVASGAECNPVQACGCPDDKQCSLDREVYRLSCRPFGSGTLPVGEPCTNAAGNGCARGLTCTSFGVCSSFCVSDRDCEASERCLPSRHPRTLDLIPGAGVCLQTCDPVSGTSCASGTSCIASPDLRQLSHAACFAIPGGGKRPGEACSGFTECARGLGCDMQAHVCAPFCRGDVDCPAQARCDKSGSSFAAPDDPVGQCAVPICNDSTVTGPALWTGGPVWTPQQFTECNAKCLDESCIASMCPDGARFVECVLAAARAYAGARARPCRAEYVAQQCCVETDCEDSRKRFDECVTRLEVSAEEAVARCVVTP